MLRRLVLILLACAAILGWWAYTLQPKTEGAGLARLERIADRSAAAGRLPGIAMALVEPGEVLWTHGAGWADIDGRRPMTPDTIMPIGSISKVFIGATAAELMARGAFYPRATLGDGWPDAPAEQTALTFENLATHTGAIVDTDDIYEAKGYDYSTDRHPVPLGEFVTGYLTPGSEFHVPENVAARAPGELYEYSNVGAALAAWMLGQSQATDFDTLSQEVLLGPLGLNATWDARAVPADERATLYQDIDGGWVALDPYALATWPDGGLHTSARDLARFLAIVMGDGMFEGRQLWSSEAISILRTPRFTVAEPEQTHQVGLFWSYEKIEFLWFSIDVEGHNGGDPGLMTFMYRDMETGRGAVLMFNGVPEGTRAQIDVARLLTGLLNVPRDNAGQDTPD